MEQYISLHFKWPLNLSRKNHSRKPRGSHAGKEKRRRSKSLQTTKINKTSTINEAGPFRDNFKRGSWMVVFISDETPSGDPVDKKTIYEPLLVLKK